MQNDNENITHAEIFDSVKSPVYLTTDTSIITIEVKDENNKRNLIMVNGIYNIFQYAIYHKRMNDIGYMIDYVTPMNNGNGCHYHFRPIKPEKRLKVEEIINKETEARLNDCVGDNEMSSLLVVYNALPTYSLEKLSNVVTLFNHPVQLNFTIPLDHIEQDSKIRRDYMSKAVLIIAQLNICDVFQEYVDRDLPISVIEQSFPDLSNAQMKIKDADKFKFTIVLNCTKEVGEKYGQYVVDQLNKVLTKDCTVEYIGFETGITFYEEVTNKPHLVPIYDQMMILAYLEKLNEVDELRELIKGEDGFSYLNVPKPLIDKLVQLAIPFQEKDRYKGLEGFNGCYPVRHNFCKLFGESTEAFKDSLIKHLKETTFSHDIFPFKYVVTDEDVYYSYLNPNTYEMNRLLNEWTTVMVRYFIGEGDGKLTTIH